MSDPFDPYREALIVETRTIWPEDFDYLELDEKEKLGAALHADPARASNLEYVRLHSGFCRQILVTADDLTRVQS
ncbi:MAG: hypothetical protein O2931_01855 [Planctomycetota bacterium]|nr:hypothetical protein [Planctomycetota bacterium]MDA1177518.1 hypothetical protein [Planctomycetota bacterium]